MKKKRFNLIDRVIVVRTIRLWFLLNFIYLEEKEIQNIENSKIYYIWSENAELIARDKPYSDFKYGGINMVNIRAKIGMKK